MKWAKRICVIVSLLWGQQGFSYNAIVNRATISKMNAPYIDSITIDGELSEWQNTQSVRVSISESSSYQAEFFLAASDKGLYVSAKVVDNSPLNNPARASQANMAWNGDALQLRLSANINQLLEASLQTSLRPTAQQDKRISHMTFWYGAREEKAHFHIARGMNFEEDQVDPKGVIAEYRFTTNGYVLEYIVPWQLIGLNQKPPAHSFIQGQWQMHWGNSTGEQLERGVTDLRQTNSFNDLGYHGPRSWGIITMGQSSSNETAAIKAQAAPSIETQLGFDQTGFKEQSVQILTEEGRLIRTLYTGPANTVVTWDGYDDLDRPQAKGRYRARRILHNGITEEWQCTLGNSGSPSWRTADGRGSQFGNYGQPLHLLATRFGLLMGTGKSEAAPSVILADSDGQKIWGSISFTQQPLAIADNTLIYQWQPDNISFSRYELESGLREDDLPLENIPSDFKLEEVYSFDVSDDDMVLLTPNKLWLYRMLPNDARWLSADIPSIKAVQLIDSNSAFIATSDGVHRLDLGDLEQTPLFSYRAIQAFHAVKKGDGWLFALALKSHRVIITDELGSEQAIIGQSEPRSVVGPYMRDAIINPVAVAISGQSVWVAEGHPYPKRFSRWDMGGNFLNEILGSITYSPAAWWNPISENTLYAGWGRYRWDKTKKSCDFEGGVLDYSVYDRGITIPAHSAPTYFRYKDRDYATVKQWSVLSLFTVEPNAITMRRTIVPRRFDAHILNGKVRNKVRLSRDGSFLYQADSKGNLWAIQGSAFAASQGVNETSEPYRIGRVPAEQWLDRDSVEAIEFDWFALDARGGAVSDLYIDDDGSFYTLVSSGDIERGESVPAAGHRIVKFSADGDIDWVYENVELAFAWNSSVCAPPRICAAMSFTRGNSEAFIGVTGYYGEYYLIDKQTGLYVTALGEDQRGDFSYGPHMVFTENFNGTLHQGSDGEVYFFAGDVDARMWRLKGINNRKIEEVSFELTSAVPEKVDNRIISDDESVIDSKRWHTLNDAGRFRVLGQGQSVVIELEVRDDSPFINAATDEHFYFNSGDAIDIQFGPIKEDAKGMSEPREAEIGDNRLLLTNKGAVLLTKVEEGYTYESPTGSFGPVRVKKLPVNMKISPTENGYYARVQLPLTLLSPDNNPVAFDIGIIFSDSAGQFSARRVLWADQSRELGINNDLPSQSRFRLGAGVLELPSLLDY